jgi:hypothetical protein
MCPRSGPAAQRGICVARCNSWEGGWQLLELSPAMACHRMGSVGGGRPCCDVGFVGLMALAAGQTVAGNPTPAVVGSHCCSNLTVLLSTACRASKQRWSHVQSSRLHVRWPCASSGKALSKTHPRHLRGPSHKGGSSVCKSKHYACALLAKALCSTDHGGCLLWA